MIVRVSVVLLKMTTAQIVETSVTVNNSSIQDNTHRDRIILHLLMKTKILSHDNMTLMVTLFCCIPGKTMFSL